MLNNPVDLRLGRAVKCPVDGVDEVEEGGEEGEERDDGEEDVDVVIILAINRSRS